MEGAMGGWMISNSGDLGNGQDWPLQPNMVIVRMA